MKKALIIMLSLTLVLSLAGCGGSGNGENSSASPAPAESEGTPSREVEVDEVKYYGIDEEAEANGLSITIDGAEPFDYTGMISRPKDGFEYVKVWFTFTNASNEPVESPDKKDLYIIYEEGPTGDDSDMTSEENSLVLPDVADRNQRYMEDEIELSPGESVSGWMVYQRQTDISEVTMHYYSGFVNVAPDLRFRFSSPTGAVPSTSVTPEATTDTEPAPVVDYTGFSIDEITGTYEVEGMGKLLQIELYKAGDMMMMRFSDGTETEYEYDLNFGVATRYAEFDDGHTVLTILTFTRDEDTIHIAIDESLTYEDGSSKFGSYEGDRVY